MTVPIFLILVSKKLFNILWAFLYYFQTDYETKLSEITLQYKMLQQEHGNLNGNEQEMQ